MEFKSKRREIAAKDDERNQGSIFLPEELVNEILLRLHIRPLFRFKLVSKRWNSIISHPKFAHCYLQRARSSSKSSSQWHLWGILDPVVASTLVCDQQWHKLGDSSKPVSTLHETDNAPPSLYSSLHKSCWLNDRIMASSGGLILSISRSYEYYSSEGMYQLKEDIHIFNPLTKQSAKLPLLSCDGSYFSLWFGLATSPVQPGGDHQAYVTFKVVVIEHTMLYGPVDDHCDVEIYTFCSDIGRWTQKKMTTCLEVKLSFQCCRKESFTCKGILHWFDWYTRTVITYDPYNSPDRFGRIQLPSGSGEILKNSGMNLIHFGHEDMLKFGDIECCNDHGRRLRLWQLLDHAKGEWRLEQTCPISPLLADDQWLGGLRKLVAPDPCNGEFFCLMVEDTCKIMKAVDLGSAEEVFMDPSKVATSWRYLPRPRNRLLLIALCPWSSPFYGQDRSNSSSEVLFEKIPHVWFPSISNN